MSPILHRDAVATEEDRPTLEAEAEGVAYVARWAESKEVVKAALVNIRKTVREIIEAVEEGAPQAKGPSDREAA